MAGIYLHIPFASNDAFIVISFLPSNTNAYRSMSTLYAKKLSGGKTTSQMNPLKRFTWAEELRRYLKRTIFKNYLIPFSEPFLLPNARK